MPRSKLRFKGSSVQHTLQQGVGKHAGCHSRMSIYIYSSSGPTRTSADVSVPRLAGFSLIT